MDDLRRLLLEATRVVAAVTMPGAVIFAVWGRELLRLWVGRSFVGSYWTLVVLSLGYLSRLRRLRIERPVHEVAVKRFLPYKP